MISSLYSNGSSPPPSQPHPVNLFKMARAAAVLSTLLFSATVIMICLAPLAFFSLRLISIHHSRRLISFLFGHWLAMWPYFFETVNRTRVLFSGHAVPPRERAVVICNHRTEVDWMYIWSLALRKQRIGHVKYVLKSSVRNVPVFGWAFHCLEFIPIERKWEVDEPLFASCLTTFEDPLDPIWLIIFPEGTDYTPEKCITSQKFAEENSLPKLNHVLLPRTRGFFACISQLRRSIDAVYDLTIGYNDRCPLFMDNAFGTDPKEVHINIKRTPISEIPLTEAEVSSWLIKEFARKDELLSCLYKQGMFPEGKIEGDLSTTMGMLNLFAVLLFTGGLMWLMFLPYFWVRMYIALSFVCLTVATFFDYKPRPIGILS